MLLDTKGGTTPARSAVAKAASLVAGALLVAGVASFTLRGRLDAPPPAGPAVGASLKAYAYELFTLYLLPVEVVGFILLITMIGVIVLSRKEAGGA
jgi:NADH-quinone oxidoreductase subunit J